MVNFVAAYKQNPQDVFTVLFNNEGDYSFFANEIGDAFSVAGTYSEEDIEQKKLEKISLMCEGFQKGLCIIAQNYDAGETFSTKHMGDKKDYMTDVIALMLRNRVKILHDMS